MIKIFRFVILLIIIAVGGFALWYFFTAKDKTEEIVTLPANAANPVEMARMCAVEIYREMPVLDTLNNKVLFAVQKQTGSISFDFDNLRIDETNDTVRVFLPKEVIDIRESTEPGSWQVIDTKAIGALALLRSDKFTLEEENVIKRRIHRKSIQRLYKNGTVAKARKQAAENLRRLLEPIYRKPVIVIDTVSVTAPV